MLKLCCGSLSNILGKGPIEFLKFEARYLPITIRDIFDCLAQIFLLISFYNHNAAFADDLSALGYAFIVPSALIAIWMIALIMKIPLFKTEYKG